MAKIIPLTNDGHTTVDDEDYDFLMQWKWRWQAKGPGGRVIRIIMQDGKTHSLFMHRIILEQYQTIEAGLEVDHRDRNPRNNTRANLRVCTHIQNCYNKSGSGGKSPFKGVEKNSLRWQARISVGGKRLYLGTFIHDIDAAKAYDAAARIYHGEFAYLNFPESE